METLILVVIIVGTIVVLWQVITRKPQKEIPLCSTHYHEATDTYYSIGVFSYYVYERKYWHECKISNELLATLVILRQE